MPDLPTKAELDDWELDNNTLVSHGGGRLQHVGLTPSRTNLLIAAARHAIELRERLERIDYILNQKLSDSLADEDADAPIELTAAEARALLADLEKDGG